MLRPFIVPEIAFPTSPTASAALSSLGIFDPNLRASFPTATGAYPPPVKAVIANSPASVPTVKAAVSRVEPTKSNPPLPQNDFCSAWV